MNLFKIAFKNIQFRPLNTSLSLILLSFGVGIISLLLLLEVQLREEFDRNIKDIDLVLGAKGSPLQLILANVYHIDAPTGNINLKEAKRVMRHPYIKEAIPLAYGDNYDRFRIVGTEHNYPAHYGAEVKDGKLWSGKFETTIGADVAQKTGLKIGDEFYSAHGLSDNADVHDDKAFTVVGIFEKSNSVIDQLILTEIASIWGVHEDHDGDHEGEKSLEEMEDEREITAVLLKKKNPLAIITLPSFIKETNMQIALPSVEINRLNENFGIGMSTLRWVAILIMIISFISVFISLYNSLKQRKYELALMRSMGGGKGRLFSMLLLEGLIMVILGIALGLILSRVALLLLSSALESQFHYDISNAGLLVNEVKLILITIFVGILASLLPAIQAVRIDISKTLSDA
jgi:putative ABC transport system permease protein